MNRTEEPAALRKVLSNNTGTLKYPQPKQNPPDIAFQSNIDIEAALILESVNALALSPGEPSYIENLTAGRTMLHVHVV